jgi:lipooligosaccharide transport system permease protein
MPFADYFRIPKLSYRLWKVWTRDRDVFMKTIKTDLLIPLVEPLLYLAAMGFGLGLFIQEINGISYVQFIAPGMVSISMMYASFSECTYSSYVRMYYNKTYDSIVATPVSLEEVVAGEVLWGATKGLINGSIVLAVIAVLGLVNGPLFLLVIPFSFLAGLLFASLAMCCTAIAPSIDAFNYPQFLFIMPMFLFSGTYFPITILPRPVQLITQLLLPLTHTVNITRGLTIGRPDPSMLLSLVWLMAVAVVLFILSINLMIKRLIR